MAFAATVLVGYPIAQSSHGGLTTPAPQRAVERPAAEGSVRALLEEHGCWTGSAPVGMEAKMPGHVVVTPDGVAPSYAGHRMVHGALDQVFAGENHGLVVHGFCR
jgi:hypothetical protein